MILLRPARLLRGTAVRSGPGLPAVRGLLGLLRLLSVGRLRGLRSVLPAVRGLLRPRRLLLTVGGCLLPAVEVLLSAVSGLILPPVRRRLPLAVRSLLLAVRGLTAAVRGLLVAVRGLLLRLLPAVLGPVLLRAVRSRLVTAPAAAVRGTLLALVRDARHRLGGVRVAAGGRAGLRRRVLTRSVRSALGGRLLVLLAAAEVLDDDRHDRDQHDQDEDGLDVLVHELDAAQRRA
ncbi:hypothetical protein ACFP4F_19345, partial [Streptomyces ochraceiscleroticus]